MLRNVNCCAWRCTSQVLYLEMPTQLRLEMVPSILLLRLGCLHPVVARGDAPHRCAWDMPSTLVVALGMSPVIVMLGDALPAEMRTPLLRLELFHQLLRLDPTPSTSVVALGDAPPGNVPTCACLWTSRHCCTWRFPTPYSCHGCCAWRCLPSCCVWPLNLHLVNFCIVFVFCGMLTVFAFVAV